MKHLIALVAILPSTPAMAHHGAQDGMLHHGVAVIAVALTVSLVAVAARRAVLAARD